MGQQPRLRRRFAAALVLVGALLLIAAAAWPVNPSAADTPTAQSLLPDQSCQPADLCSTKAAPADATPTLDATDDADLQPTESPTSTLEPTPGATRKRVSHSPPAASGYFALQPVGSWSSLASDSQCAAQVHKSTWEPRRENYRQNHTRPAPGAMAAAFSVRPRALAGTYNPLWDSWLLSRVDGQFIGRTDEIFQWAACKWGLPDNAMRATAVEESTWFQYLHFPRNASYGGGGGGSCYWNYGCGDGFSSPTPASILYCNHIATLGLLASEIHDYQKDPVTGAGGYPSTPSAGLCPKTFSILGVMSWDDPAWEAPSPAFAGYQNGTFPFTRDSTAAAADYFGAYVRGCYEGWTYWLNSSGTGNYAAGDLWGCIGSWYSGDWHSTAADTYIARVQKDQDTVVWLTRNFHDSRQQYQCDVEYGCPI